MLSALKDASLVSMIVLMIISVVVITNNFINSIPTCEESGGKFAFSHIQTTYVQSGKAIIPITTPVYICQIHTPLPTTEEIEEY